MKALIMLLLSFSSLQFLFGQNAPVIEWEKSLGGSGYDHANSIQQTSDGGFIVGGWSGSYDGDVSGNHGNDDWIVKLDSIGIMVWQKCLGGSGFDWATKVRQTIDGGYIVSGFSYSNDGDVSGNHGYDYWIVKLDTLGIIVWQKCLGGSGGEEAHDVQQTSDGGFIIAGYATSNDGDALGNHGVKDYWIVKLSGGGNLLWQKSLGGTGDDWAQSIQQTNDAGFIIAGWSASTEGDVTGNNGGHDYWIVRLDSVGNLVWEKSLGGTGDDEPFAIQQVTDGGFIVAGWSASNNNDVSGNHGGMDYWVVKLDTSGSIVWQKCFGGSSDDDARSGQQTLDGGFIIAGYSYSTDGDITGSYSYSGDYWVVKLDSSGSMKWQKSLGGNDEDAAYSVIQTSDGGFIIAGNSASNDGDVTGWHTGYDYFGEHSPDSWIVKLGSDIATSVKDPNSTFSFSISPNPSSGNFQITFPTSLKQNSSLTITNLLGQKLFEEEIIVNTSQQTFDFSEWENGMYFITVRDENSFGQKQLVLLH